LQADKVSTFHFDFRLAASVLLLAATVVLTWSTIDCLSLRRRVRTDLAEINHARYELLNANVWVQKITPILEAQIDAIDLKAANKASLRPMVQKALYRLLDDVKAKMSAKPAEGAKPAAGLGGFLGQGNPLIVNMIVGALRPHVPEYADIVLAELGRPETKTAVRNYVKDALETGAKNTFGDVDMRAYNAILQEYGCADRDACEQELGRRIAIADRHIEYRTAGVLGCAALGFLVLLTRRGLLRRSAVVVLLLITMALLVGGILTPMLEVEAKISQIKMTFLGTPIAFADQTLYYQSKSVLEVFEALIDSNRVDMWAVGILVLMFSVAFPILKLVTSAFALYNPAWLRTSRVVRFFALEASKWSMADVMALAIFMAFVAFNGLIPHTMEGLLSTGAQIAIPTNSSKILPGYLIFIGFCLASLFLSKRLAHGIRTARAAAE